MGTSRAFAWSSVAAFVLAVPLLLAPAASAAPINFTVDLTWGATTPACVGEVVCDGVGTKTFHSGTPASEIDQATSLVLTQLPQVLQPDAEPVPIGTLTYCNGQTFSTTDITSVNLLAAFDVPGAGSGTATDVATLMVTENTEDPVASADSLYLATDPSKLFTVQENDCAVIALMGKVSVEPDLVVSLGPVIPPEGGTTTTTTTTTSIPAATSSTSTTTSTTSTPASTTTLAATTTTTPNQSCLAAYYFKCAPSPKADWNCPGADTDALPADWANVPLDGTLSATDQDPWGLDGVVGPSSSGTANVGCESTSVLGTSTSNASGTTGTSGSGAAGTGLAVTGSGKSAALALMAIGLMLFGASAITSDAGRRWYATADPSVRYTIDSRRRKG